MIHIVKDLIFAAHKPVLRGKDIAAIEIMDKAEVSRTLPLAFLAPSIIRDVLIGHQPVDLTVDILRRKSSGLPLCWKAQREYLGFNA